MHQVGHFRARRGIPARADAAADVVHGRRLLGQVAPTFVGDRVDLLAFLLARGDVAEVLEHLQRRVDRARAGPVVAAHAVFECTNDVVTVAGLVLEQIEDDVLEVTATEEALAWRLAEATEAAPETAAEAAPETASETTEGPIGGSLGISPAAWAEKAEAEG